jgi:hypothetical protein
MSVLFPQPTNLQALLPAQDTLERGAFTARMPVASLKSLAPCAAYAQVGILTDPRQNPGWVAEN